MEVAVEDFFSQISDANIALFHYSGHGVQHVGENYLMPTRAKTSNARKIRHRAMNVSFLMDEMAVNTHSLARMDAPSGTIIAYNSMFQFL